MKKIVIGIMICVLVALRLCSCGSKGGVVNNAQTHEVDSEVFTQQDIDSAMEVIKNEFTKGWEGCTLKEIYYAGDETTAQYRDWADRNNAEEVIVLLSTFETGTPAGNSGLNSNQVYEGWNWILVRNAGGQWQHVDHGY